MCEREREREKGENESEGIESKQLNVMFDTERKRGKEEY